MAQDDRRGSATDTRKKYRRRSTVALPASHWQLHDKLQKMRESRDSLTTQTHRNSQVEPAGGWMMGGLTMPDLGDEKEPAGSGVEGVLEDRLFKDVYNYEDHPTMAGWLVCELRPRDEDTSAEAPQILPEQLLARRAPVATEADKKALRNELKAVQSLLNVAGFVVLLEARWRPAPDNDVGVVLAVPRGLVAHDLFFGIGQPLLFRRIDDTYLRLMGKFIHQAAFLLRVASQVHKIIVKQLGPGTFALSGPPEDDATHVVLIYPSGAEPVSQDVAARRTQYQEQAQEFSDLVRSLRGETAWAAESKWEAFLAWMRTSACKSISHALKQGAKPAYYIFPKLDDDDVQYPLPAALYADLNKQNKNRGGFFEAGYKGEGRGRWGGEESEWSDRRTDARRLAELQAENEELVAEHERLRGKLRRACKLIEKARDAV